MRRIPHRFAVLSGLAAMVLFGFMTGGCGSSEPPVPKHIFLVTIDTLRADHLGCYGYPRATSPFIDELAANGVRFEHAYTAMSTTVPAHAAIMSSLYPIQIGVLKNGHRLRDEVPTLAETLANGAFHTAAFVSTDRHFGAGGLDRGFDHFEEPVQVRKYRRAAETVDAALSWLGTREPDEPTFAWVHLFDPHAPYQNDPHSLAAIRSEDLLDSLELERFYLEERQIRTASLEKIELTLLELMDSYDAEIRYLDRELARLYHGLDSLGFNDGSIWVIVADHGEGLGNHFWLEHAKHIYNEQIRVPLIVHSPDGDLAPRVVTDLVETVDIFPALIELAELSSFLPSNIEGESLVPLLNGSTSGYRKQTAFGQRREFTKRRREFDDLKYESGEKYSLQDLRYKYIYRTEGPDEFYEIANDPYESSNLIEAGHSAAEWYLDALLRRLAEMHSDGTNPVEVDPQTIEKLRALGYIQ